MVIDPDVLRELLEAVIGGFSVLGGGMAYVSGSNAAEALADNRPPEVVAQRINEGLGRGFMSSKLLSVFTFAMMVPT